MNDIMESQNLKRKLQDETEDNPESKKPHSDSEIMFDNIGADSTHIESHEESRIVKQLIEQEVKSQSGKEAGCICTTSSD